MMFRLHNASVGYDGRAVLRDVQIDIRPGERVGLIGRSGAGKSTLINFAYNTYADDSALIPQALGLVDALSAFHNVYMGRLDRHCAFYNLLNLVRPGRRALDEIRALIEPLGLAVQLHRRAGELSGGQRQRVAVGRGLYRGARLLLADEPVSAVDATQARAVLDQLCGRYDTALIALHDIELARDYTQRLIGLAGGRIVFDSRTAAITDTDLTELYRRDAPAG